MLEKNKNKPKILKSRYRNMYHIKSTSQQIKRL